MDRETLIRATFELSREIGFRHFLAENFHRADPVLTALRPDQRTAFLRDWWDAARERMFESYREQVAGYGVKDLLAMREAYLDALGLLPGSRDKAASEREGFQQILKGTAPKEEKPQEQSKENGREMG